MPDPDHMAVHLNGESLTISNLARLARDPRVKVGKFTAEISARVKRGEKQVEDLGEAYRNNIKIWEKALEAKSTFLDAKDFPLSQDYGITTGFGEFKDRPVPGDDLKPLQENILLSHAAGVGETTDPNDPGNYFSAEIVRAVLVLRLNTFLKGYSGVSWDLVNTIRRMINEGIVPLVPLKGSVGSSGDLCPLSHLFGVLLGVGHYYVVREPKDYVAQLRKLDLPEREDYSSKAREKKREKLKESLGLKRPDGLWEPTYKEGLALTNGASFSAAMLALAVHDAEALADAADIGVALSLEAVLGCARAFDRQVHAARGHSGQSDSAANIRALLLGSKNIERANEVQDVYSLRCAPAVHGASRDAIDYARKVAAIEINAATDNPLFFPGNEKRHAKIPWDSKFKKNWKDRKPPLGVGSYDGRQRVSYSAGNFHGQPVALAADFLAIALAELANISERRTQMLLDEHHNRNLPANLVPKGGVNSGFMLAQYCAAALVSENKVLAHPASVDSIPTSANSEDHVAMATTAARKLRTVLANAQAVLAIELMIAAQAVEWRQFIREKEERDKKREREGKRKEEQGQKRADPLGIFAQQKQAWNEAEETARSFQEMTASGREGIVESLGAGTGAAYSAVREAAGTLTADRPLDGDIRRIRKLIEDRTLSARVRQALDSKKAARKSSV